MIKGLHHNAYRCRDSEETRAFYEDFLGLPFAGALEISTTQTGRATHVLHTFFQMDDGSFLAFFDDPDTPFDFKAQRDFDLHIALEVDHQYLKPMLERGREGLRHHLLGEIEVPDDPDQRCQDPARGLAVDGVQRRGGGVAHESASSSFFSPRSITGRTSTIPCWAAGILAAIWIA